MLRKTIISFVFCLLFAGSLWAYNVLPENTTPDENRVIFHSSNGAPSLVEPVGSYNTYTHELSICFPAIGFSNYTIEVSSAYASLEYYVYTPTVQINLSQMLDDQVDLTIYTESGDIYYATVDTTDAQQQTE